MTLAAVRCMLRSGGYAPIPVTGKLPACTKWQELTAATEDEIESWSARYPQSNNTGILTRLTPAIDLDITDEAAAEAVEALARERFEQRGYFLVRIGKPPKRAILLRTDEPFKKLKAALIAPNGAQDQKIEILADGQQLVVYGTHPETRRPYAWHGGEPRTIAWEDLPYVTESDAQQFLEDAVALLVAEYGYRTASTGAAAANDHGPPRANRADWSSLIADIHAGRELHDSVRDLAAKLVASGMSDGAAVNFLRGLLESSAAVREARWQDRYDDIPRAIASAREKIGKPSSTERGPEPRPYASAWWRDPATIPARDHLYGRHYTRRAIGATVAGGGRGKTTLGCYEAVSLAVGRELSTGEPLPKGPLRVWLLNGEEDQDELDRRIAATCQCYGITFADLAGRLFAESTCGKPLKIATKNRESPVLDTSVVNWMSAFISEKMIDVFMIDPLVSFHAVSESDNMHMDLVIKAGFGAVARATASAGEVFHHPGKPKPGQPETSVEDSRGASAVIWAVRSARVLNFMTPEEARSLGIGEDERRLHIRVANGKANMGPLGKAEWVKLVLENLPNGDQIAVASRWTPPDAFQGLTTNDMELARQLAATGDYRADSRSPAWFGYALAKQLGIPVSHGAENEPKDMARLRTIIKRWLTNNVLATEQRKDGNSKDKDFIVPGAFKPKPTSATLAEQEDHTF